MTPSSSKFSISISEFLIPNSEFLISTVSFLVLLLTLVTAAGCRQKPASLNATRESAYRANNLGVALLEQFKYPDAAAAFRRALQIDRSLAVAHLNLSLALLYAQDLPTAQREAEEAARLQPDAAQPPYVLGLVARAENRLDQALTYIGARNQGWVIFPWEQP